MSFAQDGPQLGNQFAEDELLQRWLRWRLPDAVWGEICEGLHRLGARVVGDIAVAAADAEANPPQLQQFDSWGRRVDRIVMAQGWQKLHGVAAEEGLVATAYEHKEKEYSRAHQFARLYLFHPSSALYSCPLAMTDGAVRVIAQLGEKSLRQRAYPRLTSRNPKSFWTSGQWMTEKSGGSDVSQTETIARRDGAGYRLEGTKWFSSAATSDMALTLARPEDREGLSLFYLETRAADGSLNGIRIEKLKDKLGTRAMPTAELTLDGTRAQLVGEHGQGVRNIAAMLNITRLYNSVCAVASMRRGLALARDYSYRRFAFGRPLIEHVLHRDTLGNLEAHYQGAFHLVFHLALLLGRDESGNATAEESVLLRLLTPVAKLFTAKLAVASASEILECFGGAGYVEDTGLPRLLRDAQVLPIWEGTTNVLSLDVSRVLQRHEQAKSVFINDVYRRIARDDPRLAAARKHINDALGQLRVLPHDREADARELALGLARVYAASLLFEFAADWPGSQPAMAALELTIRRSLVGQWAHEGSIEASAILAQRRQAGPSSD
ncbi:MAG: acyl-CoA dehydrogenase family protein [Gammaproteobacteria bacterium]|nr:acyl-CoA dehydrogenase family protein [Gammaproteobacteria bacterium]